MFPSAIVGRDSALVSAMLTISSICQLNLSAALMRFLPVSKLAPSRVVLGGYAVTALVSALGGTLFVSLAPHVSASYGFLARDPALSGLYVAAVTVWGVFALQDAVLTSLRRATWVPLENATFGIMKIAALPLLLGLGSTHSVFIAWVIPMVMLVIPVNFFIFTRAIPDRPRASDQASPVERFGRRGLARYMAQDYLAGIFIQAATTFLPALVVWLQGSTKGAYFYMPFTIVSGFDLMFVNIGYSLTVEASMAPHRLRELSLTTVRRFAGLLVAGVLALVAGAGLLLVPFGASYAHAGAGVLRLLALASLCRGVIGLYTAVNRVEGRASRVLGAHGTVCVLTLALAFAAGRPGGLQGVAVAWLAANGLVAALSLPRLLGLLVPRRLPVAAQISS
jgi:O-antigen/teichoic acid export membrane protein